MTGVTAFYTRKTRGLIEKYGPGPRIHYHVGFADDVDTADLDLPALRARMASAQEAVLAESVAAWAELPADLGGSVLDVGCGLGGSALYVAERCGGTVFALTNVSEHARLVSRLAASAGLSDRVVPIVADAHAVPTRQAFDAAIAVESSCYFERERFFRGLRETLRPGACALLVDGFVGDPAVKEEFDAYWHTDIASRAQYVAAAERCGFELVKEERLNPRAIGFWDLSIAWSRACLARRGLVTARRRSLERSVAAHWRFRGMYARGQIEYLRLGFRKVA